MRKPIGKLQEQKEELKKIYDTPANLRLKYIALGFIAAAIILMIVMIIWMDDISIKTLLFMRGCVGLCGVAFVVLCGVLVYRVNSAYMRNRDKSPDK